MNEPNEFAMSSLEKLHEKVKKAIELLDAADCPECKTKDGAYYNDYGAEVQCQWCDEVSQLEDKP